MPKDVHQDIGHSERENGPYDGSYEAEESSFDGEKEEEIAPPVAKGLEGGDFKYAARQQHLQGVGDADAADEETKDTCGLQREAENVGCVGIVFSLVSGCVRGPAGRG